MHSWSTMWPVVLLVCVCVCVCVCACVEYDVYDVGIERGTT